VRETHPPSAPALAAAAAAAVGRSSFRVGLSSFRVGLTDKKNPSIANQTKTDASDDAPVLARTQEQRQQDAQTPVVVVQWRQASQTPARASSAAPFGPRAAAPPATPDVASLLPGAELVTPQPGVSAPASTPDSGRLSAAAAAASPDGATAPSNDLFATQFGILRYPSAAAAAAAVAAFDANALPQEVYDSIAAMSVSSRMRPLEIPDPECAPDGACPAMWGMDKMRVASVWKKLAAVPAAGDAATARTAMVVDTGIAFEHFDFTTGGSSIIKEDSITFNAARYQMSPTPGFDEGNGHGTHVAGTIAGGWGSGDDRGIAGVVGRARVASCRFLADYTPADNGGTGADAARCIQHATAKKAFVINASYGGGLGGSDFLATRQAILDFCASGGVFVAAAGNDGVELGVSGWANYPAQFAGTPGMECLVAVAAVAKNDTLARWSNWGKKVRLAAPGVAIGSDWIPGPGILGSIDASPNLPGTNRAWTTISGTSMATPHVAGAALLLGNAFPAAKGVEIVDCLVATATRAAAATPTNGAQYINGGIVDVDAAYRCLEAKASGSLSCGAERLTVRLRRATTGCDALAALPGSLYFAPAGSSPSFSPAGPYAPGDYDVTVAAGDSSCVAKLTVLPCNIECGGPFEVYQGQSDGSCPAALPLPATAVWTPPGVSVTFDPPGPYPPGLNIVTATPNDPSRTSCSIQYQINPCNLRCGSPVTGTLRSGARCLEAAPFPVNGVVAPPGVTVTYDPPGPYKQGNYTVVATPNNGASSCKVKLVMPPCVPPATNCSSVPVVAELSALNRCAQGTLASLPAGSVSMPGGVTLSLDPPAPWKAPGQYYVAVTPNNGAPSCTVDLTVVECGGTPPPPRSPSPSPPPPPSPSPPPAPGPLTCRSDPIVRSLSSASGGCDGAAVDAVELAASIPSGATVVASPAGPYAPGTTAVRLTSSSTGESCDAAVVVRPCQPECAPITVNADPGQCTANSLPPGFVKASSVGASAVGVAAASPPAPFAIGRTSVSVVADYPNGVRSAPSAACPLTVVDNQPPVMPDSQTCLYPSSGGSTSTYAPSSKCFGLSELVAASDNCGLLASGSLKLRALSCANVSPSNNAASACRVANATAVCVSLRNLPSRSGTPRVVSARIQAIDGAGNAVEASAQISVYRRRGSDSACLRISRANSRVGGTEARAQQQGGAPAPAPGPGPGPAPAPPGPAPSPPPARRRGIAVRQIGA
jgi:hypothetical protein